MRKAAAFSFIFLLTIGLVSAGSITDTISDWYNEDAPELHETVCNSFAGWAFATCHPYKLDGGFADGAVDTVHNSIYSDTIYWQDGREKTTTETESHINQTYGIGQSASKLEAVKSLNNGTGESVAQNNAFEELDAFYTQLQMRIVSWRNREALKFNTSLQEIERTDGLTYGEVYEPDIDTTCNYGPDNLEEFTIGTANYTLYNGSTVDLYTVDAIEHDGADTGSCEWRTFTVYSDDLTTAGTSIIAKDYSGDKTNTALNATPYNDAKTELDDARTRAQDNIGGIVTEIYDNYAQDEISVSESLGPLEALITGSTSYEDTGYYSYKAVSLEQMGLASNRSYAFNVTFQNPAMDAAKTVNGQLFVEEGALNGTVEAGVNYSVTDYAAWIVYQDGDRAVEKDITGWFEVEEMINTDTGEKVNVTGVQSTKLYTQDTQELQEQINDFEAHLEALESNTMGGGALSDATNWLNDFMDSMGWNIPDIPTVVWVIALVFLAFVLATLKP